MHAKLLLLCPTLCDPMGYSPQAPLSMGFSRQEYWSGLSFPPPGDLPDPGIKLVSPVSPAVAGVFFTAEPPEKPPQLNWCLKYSEHITIQTKLKVTSMLSRE